MLARCRLYTLQSNNKTLTEKEMSKQTHPYGYWTDDRIIEESKKYKTKIEFKAGAPTAYKKANEKKLIKEMTWLKTDRHKKRGPRASHKYTKDVIVSIIQEYACITYADFRRINEYAYNQAKKYGWLPELGLIKSYPGKDFWTEEKVMEVAHNYSNKTDFSEKEPAAYSWACEYKILDKFDWMKPRSYDERKEEHNSTVYAYVDKKNKIAYVGLTIDSNSRRKSHKYESNSAVRKYFGKNIPEPIILKDGLTVLESQYYEDYYKKQYAKNGYNLLNVAPTGKNIGSIGGIAKWTSKEKVFEESKKYHSRSEFQREAGGAYNHAKHNKWLPEMTWLTTPKRKVKWTHDAVIEESHKYEYKCEFRKKASGAHQTASENDWLKEMTWLKDKKRPHNYWTKERVFEESHKYSNKKDFENNAKTAFLKAMSNGWLPLMKWLKPLPLGKISKWTREAIIEESKKYTSRTEFAINSPTAYQHACEDKTIFKEMPWIKEKKKPDDYWDVKEHVLEESKKYKNLTEFSIGAFTAWRKAKDYGWIDEIEWAK